MMKTISISIILALLFPIVSLGQKEWCGTEPHVHHLTRQDPAYQQRRQQIERFTRNYLNNQNAVKKPDSVVIPVVVHIVTPSIGAPENITKEQVYSQIDVLNEDFSRSVADSAPSLEYPPFWRPFHSGDTRIRFCLARLDPEGNITSGITRTMTTQANFSPFDEGIKFDQMGGKDAWPNDLYLNIWVGRIDENSGYAGYATYPGASPYVDGVVVDFRYFGRIGTALPTVQGRTCVHEVGHWLNLIHTWGPESAILGDAMDCESDDLVADTPRQLEPSYACSPITSSCDGQRDMLSNFMNYAPGTCRNFFTKGQANRMWAVLVPGGERYKLTQSDRGCRTIVWRRDD